MAGLRVTVAGLTWVLAALSATSSAPLGYAGDEPKIEQSVAAKRYRTWVFSAEGRGGRWIEELFFPEKGVCANVEQKFETKDKSWEFASVLNAFHGPIRNRFVTNFDSSSMTESPVEDVRVPASLATAIYEAAELQRRLEQARHDVGSKVSGLGLCRDLDENGKPREAPVEPAMK